MGLGLAPGPTAAAAQRVSGAAESVSQGLARTAARRRAQAPMTAQSYLNEYGINVANPNWGTRSQYETARARMG